MNLVNLGKAVRDPLFQFLVVGALAFSVHRLRAPKPRARIVVREEDVAAFAARIGSPLTSETRTSVLSQLIAEEALVREATAISLPENDLVIRRRLAQTMTFMAESALAVPEPTEEELRRRFAAKPPVSEDVLSLDHAFVRAGPDAEARAGVLLSQLATATGPLGDPYARGHRFEKKTVAEISAALGDAVAKAAPGLPLGTWSGPFSSPLGLHLVRISERSTRTTTFEDARARLRLEEIAERRTRAARDVLRKLLERYVVELPDGTLRPASSLVP